MKNIYYHISRSLALEMYEGRLMKRMIANNNEQQNIPPMDEMKQAYDEVARVLYDI